MMQIKRMMGVVGAAAVVAGSWSAGADATLLITEIQSNQGGNGADDFWELTNFGAASVDLDGWVWNDDQATFDGSKATPITGVVIAPGESVVFANASNVDAATFRAAWGIDGSVQVFVAGPGLGQNDAINLFDPSQTLVTTLSYAAGGFTKSDNTLSSGGHAGISAGGSDAFLSLVWDPTSGTTSPRYTFAQVGQFGAFQAAAGTDVGSPGVVPEPGAIALLGLGGVAMLARRRKA